MPLSLEKETVEELHPRIEFKDVAVTSIGHRHSTDWHDVSRRWFKPSPENPKEIVKRYMAKASGSKWACEIRAISSDKIVSDNIQRIIDCHLPYLAKEDISPFEREFNQLVEQWRDETRMYSILSKKIMNPSYQKIIGMGKEALPLIFRELNDRGGHWIWALCAITREDAAKAGDNLKEAKAAWLQWGKAHGYL
jgi:hypothetical protein